MKDFNHEGPLRQPKEVSSDEDLNDEDRDLELLLQANSNPEGRGDIQVRQEDREMDSDKSDTDDLFKMFLKEKPADTSPDKEMKTDLIRSEED